MKNVLIIEDEKNIARFMELELKYEGYNVSISYDGRSGLETLRSNHYDIIILDIMLPKLNGFELCKKIREFSDIPIIMVTAKSDVSDIVTGLDIGADDYLTKPFNMEELLARMRKLLKLSRAPQAKSYKAGNIVLDDSSREVFQDDKIINLSKTEFELLKYLIINLNIVVSREQILDNVWGYDSPTGNNVVDVYIKYLRDKIVFGGNAPLIKTIRGVGYILKY